ncbi:hypothetical protein Halha_0727 [Halobacteroides halobius DSM 5150]|uniref:Uncharacterized protein n=1 Tax=Halobacteroides halobius (strain ATCC 35273 / DSM 5150 / MD-1) TaxID=748449 RepID=L0K827_HALHC|nr:hypothetical protein [Halobacteroides halobius]AGB40700.1 hypothetical protein Halha_0727 [Halobacteroides halobius DSM 5150]
MRRSKGDYEVLLEITDADNLNNSYALLRDEERYGIENNNINSPYNGVTWKNSADEMLDYIEENVEETDDYIKEHFIGAIKGKLKMLSYQQ